MAPYECHGGHGHDTRPGGHAVRSKVRGQGITNLGRENREGGILPGQIRMLPWPEKGIKPPLCMFRSDRIKESPEAGAYENLHL